jgi:hypothetical protein
MKIFIATVPLSNLYEEYRRSATKNTSAKSTREKFNISLKTSIDL